MSTTDKKLTPRQVYALVVLMCEARPLNNTELKELAGFSLTGEDNKVLERAGLVTTDRTKRPFVHELTDKGWHRVRELHTTEPHKAGGAALRSMYTLLANIQRSLERLQLSHGEFFKQHAQQEPPQKPRVQAKAASSTSRTEVENLIREAYHELARVPGDWVGLADLRDRLHHVDRATVDEALRAMVRQKLVRLVPNANTKGLEARDRAAALRIGGEDHHSIAIGQ